MVICTKATETLINEQELQLSAFQHPSCQSSPLKKIWYLSCPDTLFMILLLTKFSLPAVLIIFLRQIVERISVNKTFYLLSYPRLNLLNINIKVQDNLLSKNITKKNVFQLTWICKLLLCITKCLMHLVDWHIQNMGPATK